MDFSSEFSSLNDTFSNIDLSYNDSMDISSQYIWSDKFFMKYFTFMIFVSIVILVFSIVVNWKIFTKAGEDGWKSLIPIYNIYILYKIAWGNGMLFLLLLIPFVNFIVGIITINKISKSFGYGIGFTLVLIFVPLIFYPILAFGRSRYLGVVNY